MARKFLVKNEAELEKIAGQVAVVLEKACGDSPLEVSLEGPLGAGKTTFTRYLVAALGAKEPVSSPSFVLEHEYQGRCLRIEHWDLYRLKTLAEDLLEPPAPSTLRLVEWGDCSEDFSARADLRVSLDYGQSAEERRIVFAGPLSNQL